MSSNQIKKKTIGIHISGRICHRYWYPIKKNFFLSFVFCIEIGNWLPSPVIGNHIVVFHGFIKLCFAHDLRGSNNFQICVLCKKFRFPHFPHFQQFTSFIFTSLWHYIATKKKNKRNLNLISCITFFIGLSIDGCSSYLSFFLCMV